MTMYREPLDDEIESCRPETEDQRRERNAQCRLMILRREREQESFKEAARNHISMLTKAATEIDPDAMDRCMRDADEWHRRVMRAIGTLSSPRYGMADIARRDLRQFRLDVRNLLVSLAIQENDKAEEMGR